MKINSNILIFLSIVFLSSSICIGQTDLVDHWETVVYADDLWRYFVGDSEPDSNWRSLVFNDSVWQQGNGGFGYSDGDDATIIEPTISIFLRQKFTIIDTSVITKAIFNIDYDDAFVAYLNDFEIARSNIGIPGDHPEYDQTANTWIEAQMYQGGQPEYYYMDKEQLSFLNEGENVLSIQVHNQSLESSDLSAIPFFSVGISTESNYYRSTPEWFRPPFEFVSSNLPIFIIDTEGQQIVDEPRIVAQMGIITNESGTANSVTDPFNEYDGRINIEIRGSSSQSFPKKSYGFETQDSLGENLNVSLLKMPRENDWILYGPYSDKTLLRNVICFDLGRALGQYASRTEFCELVINGDYKGLYVLMERIKRDDDRVDISRITPEDISGDALTGGYIIKVDKEEGDYGGWRSTVQPPYSSSYPIFYQFHDPEHDEVVAEQKAYIQNFFYEFEQTLIGQNFKDRNHGYAKFINMETFVDHFLLQELTKNIDGFKYSAYFYKDRDSIDGRLTMGPFWDFNLAFGNVDFGFERAQYTDDWMHDKRAPRFYWWERMMEDEFFRDKAKTRWQNLRQGIFHIDSIRTRLNEFKNIITEARVRNFERWPVLGQYVWPNFFVGDTYEEEMDFLINWITDRLIWMDENLPGNYDPTVIEKTSTNVFQSLTKAYPNPFHSKTHIYYHLSNPANIKIEVYDILGRKVQFYNQVANIRGNQTFSWNGQDQSGKAVASGVYLYLIRAEQKVLSKGKLLKIP